MKKRLFALHLIFVMLFSVTLYGDEEESYRLKDGEAYMDQTFIYSVEGQEGREILVLCAEMNAPTYDEKKGLMTWIDYKVYSPEDIFGLDAGGHIRSILELAGPHLDSDQVVEELKELTGISELTYDEVVSAMQYGIWFFSDQDFRIPTSSNGEDLYRYFVTLPPSNGEVNQEMPNVSQPEYTVDEEENQILIDFNYSGPSGSNLSHSYSTNIVTNYNGKESIRVEDGVYYVRLTIPRVTMSMDIDFEVTVSGTMPPGQEALVFAPEERGSVQMLVGIGDLGKNRSMRPRTREIRYRSYRLILNDGSEQTITSHREDTIVTLDEINYINPTGKSGFRFDGWLDESGLIVFEGVLMDHDRVLDALYSQIINQEQELPDEDLPTENPEGVDPEGDKSNPGGDEPEGDSNNPGGEDPDGDDSNPDGQEPEEQDLDLDDESIPEDSNPGWMPNTGGVPLLIFVTSGSIALILGVYLRKKPS